MIRDWGIITRNINLGDCIDVIIQENDYYLFYDYTIKDAIPLGRGKYQVTDEVINKIYKVIDKAKSYYMSLTPQIDGSYKFRYLSNKAKNHKYYGDVKQNKNNSEDSNEEVRRSGEDLREYGYQVLIVK